MNYVKKVGTNMHKKPHKIFAHLFVCYLKSTTCLASSLRVPHVGFLTHPKQACSQSHLPQIKLPVRGPAPDPFALVSLL